MRPPKVVIVAQSFKESIAAPAVAEALDVAARTAGATPIVLRASDGGDGLLEALTPCLVRFTKYQVEDPLRRLIEAPVGWLAERTAVIESRLACGLSLLAPHERDPLVTTTRGVGALIRRAVADGADRVFVGLGGSATVDGGLGMARDWGWAPVDGAGQPLAEGGGALATLARLGEGTRPTAHLVGLCDVATVLTGPRGARVFAAQKGASPAATTRLAAGLERLAEVANAAGAGPVAQVPGAGAAGGLGFGLAFFGNGELVAGAPWVLERVGFSRALTDADLVVVAEGAFDETSLEGKLSGVVISLAREAGVAVLLIAPTATHVPAEVIVESGGGWWSAADVTRRGAQAVSRALRLLGH